MLRNGSDNFKKKGLVLQKVRRFQRNESFSSEDEDDYGFESDDECEKQGRSVREIRSRAALGKYDVKITKRIPLKELDEEMDFEKEVEFIRYELEKKKKLDKSEGEIGEEDSILS